MSFAELPEEILSVVVSWLSTPDEDRWDIWYRTAQACKKDVASFSLVSHTLRRLCLPALFGNVTFKFDSEIEPTWRNSTPSIASARAVSGLLSTSNKPISSLVK